MRFMTRQSNARWLLFQVNYTLELPFASLSRILALLLLLLSKPRFPQYLPNQPYGFNNRRGNKYPNSMTFGPHH